jgi:hypothetical protein
VSEQYDIDIRVLIDPDNVDAHYLILPRDDVLATRAPLLEPKSPNGDVWWQLPEAERHAFRVVYFTAHNIHAAIAAAVRGDPKNATQAVVTWLRWLAVRQAKSESLTWPKAYECASERLKGTVAHGRARTMKAAYVSVARILKARGGTPAVCSPRWVNQNRSTTVMVFPYAGGECAGWTEPAEGDMAAWTPSIVSLMLRLTSLPPASATKK